MLHEHIPDLRKYIPDYIEPTPEEIAQHQTENAARLAEFENRNQRIDAIFARLGGHKSTDLDERYSVFYCVDNFREMIAVQGEDTDDQVGLTPLAALKLLAWLEQERAILEELAKEQEV